MKNLNRNIKFNLKKLVNNLTISNINPDSYNTDRLKTHKKINKWMRCEK